jgi:hydrogenase expression/formation protein HypD
VKFIDEYRDPALAQKIIERICRRSNRPARLMEFCGGHTVAIFKYGLRQLLPDHIEMLSGPGCPVCVTATRDLDKAIALARLPDVIVTTFGDMLRVPGSRYSLLEARSEGGDVRVVYSTQDALKIAANCPDKRVVFIGIGFETTAPTVAAAILQAEATGLTNFSVLALHKLCPPIMKALLDLGEVKLDGIICPGHVSAVIGARPYQFIADDYGIACAVSGFEPLDILLAVDRLVAQIETGRYTVDDAYRRGVKPEGNTTALNIMERVFEVTEADWRGLGVVPGSGLVIRDNYRHFDAEAIFNIEVTEAEEKTGCICGAILRGVSTPRDCSLFRKVCTPGQPVGPCMVSSEGACATYYHYGDSYE